jgi:hypothetical protein
MAISVELRDAQGRVLDRLAHDSEALAQILPPVGDPRFPMLGFIDPYGDTIFSSLQMRALIPEVEHLYSDGSAPIPVLRRLRELADECAAGVHVFLVFIGD